MVKTPREVGGCIALPLQLPATSALRQEATHYLYLRPHDPKIPDPDAPRTLFLVNIPVSTTAQSLKQLFTTRLEGGLIERVNFSETFAHGEKDITTPGKSSRKRKRMTAEEIEAGLDILSLPKVFDSVLHKSGATASVVFVDRASMEATLKAARRATKAGVPIPFDDVESTSATFGLQRYTRHQQLQFPARKDLLRSVNAFMTAYTRLEESRSRENARKRAEPDEDGFVTVTRGSRGSVRMDEAKEIAERQKEKAKGLEDFYRFQTRQRRKKEQESMLQRFEEDKRKVEEMRKRRGRVQG